MRAHEGFIRRCLELAETARARSDTPVGSLIVKHGEVVAEASEKVPTGLDPTGHAEVLAIRQACGALGATDLSGCTLYSTAEPCWLCSYAIRETGISRVIYSRSSPPVGGTTSTYPILRTTGISFWGDPPEIIGGVLEY